MRRTVPTLTIMILCLVPGLAFADDAVYEVTITNITQGQIMGPPVVVSHDSSMSLFELGHPASDELAALAEDADSFGLVALLESSDAVADVTIGGGPILPGHSMTLSVSVSGGQRLISFATMLVTTNDTFAALNGMEVHGSNTVSTLVLAYDSGSEGNNELCIYIPGPPCGNPFQRDVAGAEGYVHINAGVQQTGDLTGEHDWRNPVASVSIRRAR